MQTSVVFALSPIRDFDRILGSSWDTGMQSSRVSHVISPKQRAAQLIS